MARTHKTALIKQQMADEAAAREAAEAAAAVDRAGGKAASVKAAHREAVHSARTRSEKADAIQRARNDCAETEAEEDTELEEKPAATSVRHRSWAEFTQAFDVYKAATNQVLVVKEVINVARRNNSLRNQVQYQGLPDDEIPLVPTTLDPSQRKYICTHGWPARERSSGKRTSHHVRRPDCPFQLIAQWAQSADESWVIVPKRAVYTHNHQVSTGIYQQYPGIRQVPSQSPLVPGVRLLMQTQAGPSSIYEYIRENSDHHVTMQDVRNLVARLRNSGELLTVQTSRDQLILTCIYCCLRC
ncbi:hypothetical protein PPTG_05984 [Phytophthora nicotianae INRA-310]|uniref:Uncharacterized protein n=1 Tax=Phytophthora nicotianae (strain INRA-310) TaxID=761204 RepID=W2QWQ5_PHYN3|nr:hypothetical protein PPTG_05984 [Phytophthora nicotianae INRA-310]ETN16889.1 hypothetical protein PPTG_05984 [Phytophthora nicotianae INRA-310]